MDHLYALRAPWYVRERNHWTPFDDDARRPALQKYAGTDFVDRMLADPRDSVRFDDDDRWAFPVAVPFGTGSGRKRFVTSGMVRTPLRKLYQPLHERYYTVVTELFCDQPGLPRAGETAGVDLSFVVRRERTLVRDPAALRELAHSLAGQLYRQQEATTADPSVPETDDLDDVVAAARAAQVQLSAEQLVLLARIAPRQVTEGWVAGPGRSGHWQQVDDDAPPVLLAGELELPMWQLPPRDEDCTPARTRSLWFGVVPTHGSDLDERGLPRLDDRTIYRIRCVARRHPGPGHEHCPDRFSWSEPTLPYRLAAHADPEGTKNHRVTITMPDLRAVAARAGRAPGPGGVEIVQPPGSQLQMDTTSFPPTRAPGADFGADTSRCTFALELFMIVSMFVFSLFLPIVMFVFQLWWLLLLRFCWPRADTALADLDAYFKTGTIADLLNQGTDTNAQKAVKNALLAELDEVTEIVNAGPQLVKNPDLATNKDAARDLVASLDPLVAGRPHDPAPEEKPADPLCLSVRTP
jgi:hypothetical protein